MHGQKTSKLVLVFNALFSSQGSLYNNIYNDIFRLRMRAVIIFLVLALVALQYKLWVGDSSVIRWLHLEKKLVVQEERNKQFAARNRAAEAEVLELKSGDNALEEQARSELGMVKDGEVYYQYSE